MILLRRTLMLMLGCALSYGRLAAETEDRSRYNSYFESAAAEFDVPADVLRGLAFSTTRWSQLVWADGDTASSCSGHPRVYGIMGLWDNDLFGRTLREAASLIGRDVNDLKQDPLQNIRGGAALLKKLYRESSVPAYVAPGSIESWENAIARYTGIPQPELSHKHALGVFTRLQAGYHRYGIDIEARTLNLDAMRRSVESLEAVAARTDAAAHTLNKTTGTPDYPPAKWVPGTPDCYYTSGNGKVFVVVHDMEGYYASVVSGFKTRTDASVHYCLNSAQDNAGDGPAGEVTQMVEEKYYAWHAVCLNRYSLGIEHEGFVSNPAWFTDEMYLSSANLVRHMCDKFNIPMDRNHIIAHGEWQNASWVNWVAVNYPAISPSCNSHTDPGKYWDWSFYMQMIRGDTTTPRVTSVPPVTPLQVYDKIRITFSDRMNRTTVEKNFSIAPAVPGSFAWETDNRTVTFTPNVYLAFDAQYTVTIDTGAHNHFGKALDQNADGAGDIYSFSFSTVKSDLAAPTVMQSYPRDAQADISVSASIRITFSEVMDASTMDNAVVLTDSLGASMPFTKTVTTAGGLTLVVVTPNAPFVPGASYTLTVTQDAKDLSGNPLNAVQTVAFRTVKYPLFTGTVVDNIDASGGWWQPSASGGTVNTLNPTFKIVGSPKFSGTGSGMITYQWVNATGGICREHNGTGYSIEGGTIVGLWVYGDNSGNNLELSFYYGSPKSYTSVSVGTLNWTGWKLVSLPVSSVPGSSRLFEGLRILQKAGAAMSGVIYIDALTVGTTITEAVRSEESAMPSTFTLEQNYPNPFNPTTHFRFSLPAARTARLSVHDVLGREVAVVMHETLGAGTYTIEWNATGIPSGVYFYTLRAGAFSETKKLLLNK